MKTYNREGEEISVHNTNMEHLQELQSAVEIDLQFNCIIKKTQQEVFYYLREIIIK